jgi:hypothetical protein
MALLNAHVRKEEGSAQFKAIGGIGCRAYVYLNEEHISIVFMNEELKSSIQEQIARVMDQNKADYQNNILRRVPYGITWVKFHMTKRFRRIRIKLPETVCDTLILCRIDETDAYTEAFNNSIGTFSQFGRHLFFSSCHTRTSRRH